MQLVTPILSTDRDPMADLYFEVLRLYINQKYLLDTDVSDIDPSDEKYMKEPCNINVGMECFQLLHNTNSKITAKERETFFTDCQNYLKTACMELKKRCNYFKDKQISERYILHPENALNKRFHECDECNLNGLIEAFPQFVQDSDKIKEQWGLLMEKQFSPEVTEEKAVDIFWSKILDYSRENNNCFEHLCKFALSVLLLPNSNASSERVWSKLNLEKTALRNRLHFETVQSILFAAQFGTHLRETKEEISDEMIISTINTTSWQEKNVTPKEEKDPSLVAHTYAFKHDHNYFIDILKKCELEERSYGLKRIPKTSYINKPNQMNFVADKMEPNRMTQNRETEGEQLVCSSANPASSYNKRVVKTYSREDKLKAIECILIHGKTKAYVARTYNIPESTLRGWVNRANVALVSKKNLNDEYSASSVRSESPLNNPLTYPVASLAANTPMVPNERRQHNDSDTDAQFKNNLAAFNPTLIPNAVQNLLHKTSYPYTANDLIKTFPPCMAGNHLLGNITPTSIGQMPSSLAQNNPLFMPDGFQNAKSNVNKNNLAAEPSQANFAYALLQQQLHQQQSQRQAANLLNGGTFSNVNSIWGLFPSVFSNFAASSTNSVSSTVTSQNFDNKPSRGIKPISDKPLLSSQTCRKYNLHGCLHSTKEKIDSDNKTHGFTMSKEYIESGIIKGEQFVEFLEGLGDRRRCRKQATRMTWKM
ncbi:hypothetical protein TKK_0004789 [Trichogramma kaykai]